MEKENNIELPIIKKERKPRTIKPHCVGTTKYQQLKHTSPDYYKKYYDEKTKQSVECHICDCNYTVNHKSRHLSSKKHVENEIRQVYHIQNELQQKLKEEKKKDEELSYDEAEDIHNVIKTLTLSQMIAITD